MLAGFIAHHHAREMLVLHVGGLDFRSIFETRSNYMRSAYIMTSPQISSSRIPLGADSTRSFHGPFGFFSVRRIAIVRSAGLSVLRYGLVFLLLAGGAVKFADFEAQGIRPFIEHSPFLSWMYSIMSVRVASGAIGIVELTLGIGIALRRWLPVVSGMASLAATLMFVLTWSFFFTTPGAMDPGSDVGGFLMKDLILLGASLAIAAEALTAARARVDVDAHVAESPR